MADPVFAENRAALVSKLRLSSDIVTSSEAVLDEAILQVRVAFFQRLGAARVSSISSTAYTESATSESAILRLAAAQVELYGVKARLLRDAPVFFMDAKNDAEEQWNDDDLLRNGANDEDLVAYYESLFQAGMDSLVSGEEERPGVRMSAIAPDNDAQKIIGRSITNGRGLGGMWP